MATLAERLAPAISPGRAHSALKRWWAGWALTAALAFLILYPLVALFQGSVQDRDGGAFSLDAYRTTFTSAETYELIWTTVWLAAVRVIPATVIGVFLAWVVARTDTPWRGGIELMMWIKFFAPPLPIVMAWVLLGGRTGILNQWLGELPFVDGPVFDVYSYAGIIWVSTFGVAAFIFLLTLPAFRAMDASLEEVGRLAGATRLEVLRLITVPVLLPSVLGAVFLSFIFLLESFETEMILGVPRRIYVLSTRIYSLSEQYPTDLPTATALSSFFLVAVALLIVLQIRVLSGRSFVTVSGRGHQTQVTSLGKWRWFTFGLCILYLVISGLIPLVTLIAGSFMKAWGIWTAQAFTLDHWVDSLGDPRLLDAVRNTVVLGILVGAGGTAICALVAYLLVRSRFPGRSFLEFVTWAPRAAPGVVLAVAFTWAYVSGLPLFRPINGTLWLLALVLIVNAVPVATRITSGAMHQVAYELEEAARISGARWFTTFREVLLPLLAPALLTSFVLLFLTAIRNLVLVLFFYTPESRVLSVIFWEGWAGRAPERALVTGLMMMLLSGVALAFALVLRKRTGMTGF